MKTAGPPAGFVLLSGAVPIEIAPSRKVTRPVGKPGPGEEGVARALHSTGWPRIGWDAVDAQVIVSVVRMVLTRRENAEAVVLPAKFVSPRYCAVIKCVPAVAKPTPMDAGPAAPGGTELLSCPFPIGVPPSKKLTVPVGMPTAGRTGLTTALHKIRSSMNVPKCGPIPVDPQDTTIVVEP